MVIFKSPHGTLALPKDRTIWDDLEKYATETPDARYLICGASDRVITYKEAYDRACAIAAGLYDEGLRKGDVVIALTINCVEYPILFLALNRLTVTCSPSFTEFQPHELARQLLRTKAKRIFVHPSMLELARQGAAAAGFPENLVFSLADTPPPAGVRSLQEFLAAPRPLPPLPRVDPDAVVMLPFSSGTAGHPKGVLHTARGLYAAAMHDAAIEERHPVILAVLPFYHIFATNLLHVTTQLGLALLVLPGFEPELFLRCVSKYKVEKLSVVPAIAHFLAVHPLVDKFDLSATKYVVTAATAQPLEDVVRIKERLGIEVQQGYGMTEFAGGVVIAENGKTRAGSVGRLLPNVELKIKSLENDQDLGPNQRGELLFRTPQTMIGYLDNTKATKAMFTDDGFLRTGDLGFIDDDGYVFIVDRIKSLIKYKGHQVSPVELEEILVRHPLIAEACCVRGRDLKTGEEIPKAYIVVTPNPPKRLTRMEVQLFVASKVAAFKRVRDVEFIDAIPKNAMGKIDRRKLQVRENIKQKGLAAPPPSLSRL